MDILTPKGQETLKQEQRAMEILGSPHIPTPKDEPADIDGVFYKEEITGLYEVKCRVTSYNQLQNWGSWIITQDKVFRGAALAKAFRVPLFGILYLVPEDMVLVWKLADKHGKMLYNEAKHTQTRETVNGGQKVRYNAFYHLTDVLWISK